MSVLLPVSLYSFIFLTLRQMGKWTNRRPAVAPRRSCARGLPSAAARRQRGWLEKRAEVVEAACPTPSWLQRNRLNNIKRVQNYYNGFINILNGTDSNFSEVCILSLHLDGERSRVTSTKEWFALQSTSTTKVIYYQALRYRILKLSNI